jgi:hypothetical protein
MANAKLTALPADTSLASTDILYVVIDPLTTPVSKQATIATVVSAAGAIAVTTVTASGLLTGGNITTAGTIGAAAITSSALLTGANITTAGTIGAAAITSSALLTGANISTAGTVGAGAITSSALLTAANISTAGTIGAASLTASGNIALTGGTLTLGTIVVARGTNSPALGTWNAGDILFNSIPAVGTVTGWICTVGGTAGGTWLGFGTL